MIRITVSVGDYNGIGPEIIIKAFSNPKVTNLAEFSFAGSEYLFRSSYQILKKQYAAFEKLYKNGYDYILDNLIDSETLNHKLKIQPGVASSTSGEYARASIDLAIEQWKTGRCDAIVTAPIMKETFFRKDEKFNGQTEWIADRCGCKDSLMIMCSNTVRIAMVTTHVALKDVPGMITKDRIAAKGTLLYKTLVQDFNIKQPEIAVMALNPHAGEYGRFGSEETEIIEPAIADLIKNGGNWAGPIAADSVFFMDNNSRYDGILALYHDQGLIPFKLAEGMSGVNFTGGLPIIRVSPDHGTAFAIAGKGLAEESSISAAIKQAVTIAKNRNR